MGPADKTARDNSEVSIVEGVLGTSNVFTWLLVSSGRGSAFCVRLISGVYYRGNWMS